MKTFLLLGWFVSSLSFAQAPASKEKSHVNGGDRGQKAFDTRSLASLAGKISCDMPGSIEVTAHFQDLSEQFVPEMRKEVQENFQKDAAVAAQVLKSLEKLNQEGAIPADKVGYISIVKAGLAPGTNIGNQGRLVNITINPPPTEAELKAFFQKMELPKETVTATTDLTGKPDANLTPEEGEAAQKRLVRVLPKIQKKEVVGGNITFAKGEYSPSGYGRRGNVTLNIDDKDDKAWITQLNRRKTPADQRAWETAFKKEECAVRKLAGYYQGFTIDDVDPDEILKAMKTIQEAIKQGYRIPAKSNGFYFQSSTQDPSFGDQIGNVLILPDRGLTVPRLAKVLE